MIHDQPANESRSSFIWVRTGEGVSWQGSNCTGSDDLYFISQLVMRRFLSMMNAGETGQQRVHGLMPTRLILFSFEFNFC